MLKAAALRARWPDLPEGEVRAVLELRHPNIARLVSEFEGGDFYVPPREVLEEESARAHGGHFNLIHRDTATSR